MGVFWLLLLAVIVFAVVRLLPGASASESHRDSTARRESPEDILDRRFAHGELDLETYQQQRTALAQHRDKP